MPGKIKTLTTIEGRYLEPEALYPNSLFTEVFSFTSIRKELSNKILQCPSCGFKENSKACIQEHKRETDRHG